MEQSWLRKNPEIQQEQDLAFIQSANPKLSAELKELSKLIEEQGKELGPEIIELPFNFGENLTPEQIAYNQELTARLYKALLDPKLLKEREKKLIQTIFFEGKSHTEVAGERNIKEVSVKTEISQILQRIRNSKYFIDLRPTSTELGKLKV